jgi:3-oxoacyl-[acyl-carrier protein] reductase
MARVLVTGAASGIGAATADLLEEGGWEVARADLKPGVGMLALDTADETGLGHALDAVGGVDALGELRGAP